MFGTNKISKQDEGSGQFLKVNEIFSTIQGEGPFSGQPAIFIRLQGCNLACTFCDTEFESGIDMSLSAILGRIKDLNAAARLIVLTGGEPMLQQIIPLLEVLTMDEDYVVQIETAGTVWPEPVLMPIRGQLPPYLVDLESLIVTKDVQLVCSPKTPKIHPKVEQFCAHYKYIVRSNDNRAKDGLPTESTQRIGIETPVFRPDRFQGSFPLYTIWVQPCEEYYNGHPDSVNKEGTELNIQHAAKLAMKHDYRLSLQVHKIIGLP